MEYYAQYNTGKTNSIIEDTTPTPPYDNFFLNLTADISAQNVNKDGTGTPDFINIEGGPFAAVIVRYHNSQPTILGIGANHVVPECDPSAHGEIAAIRDATARLGYSDLSDTIIYSSCECCPQCQAAIAATGIRKVFFANTRFQAAEIGFSDEEQYRHLQDFHSSITQTDNLELIKKLGEHGAIILDSNHNIIAYGEYDLQADPLASLPSINAIRNACKAVGNFHLPEDYILITRNKIHPIAFTTADWARIGRVRDKQHPNDPTYDEFAKDASKILYVESHFEEIILMDESGKQHTPHTAEAILHDLQLPPAERTLTPSIHIETPSARNAFAAWKAITNAHTHVKY